MINKRILPFVTALTLLCVSLSGCSTSAGEFASDYFPKAIEILGLAGGSAGNTVQTSTDAIEASETIQIDSPAEFTLDAEGNYRFTTVADAAQYYIYLCDVEATDDNDDYLYACQIDAEDTDYIIGELPFDYKYGEYLVKVFAVSDDNTFSTANMIDYIHSGEITTPRVAYSWDGSGTITFDVVNIPAYEYTSCPNVEITITDLASGADTIVMMEDVADSAYLETSLAEGEYKIVATGVTDSVYVTNQETGSYTISEDLILDSSAAESADYEIRATYTSVEMFGIDFTTRLDTAVESTNYTWANVLNVVFTEDTSMENDWTEYYYIGEGTGTDGLHAEIAFKADGTCRMIVRGGPYGGNMGGERIAETGADGYEWVVANGNWSIAEGVITFTVEQ